MHQSSLSLFIVLGLSTAACGGGEARVEHPARPDTRCYAGPSQTFALPGNQRLADGTIVARRTVDRARGQITEEVASGMPGQPVRRFHVTMTVTGSRFVMTERAGAFTGDGTLVGPSWAWTAWQSTSRLPDGTVVKSSDRTSGDGFVAEKVVTSPDGVDRIRFVEHVTALPCADFEARIAALGQP